MNKMKKLVKKIISPQQLTAINMDTIGIISKIDHLELLHLIGQ
jgi:hypothetical protein